MISLNDTAAAKISESGETVSIARGPKTLGSLKTLIEPSPQGFFAAVALNPYLRIQPGDVLASEKRRLRTIRCVTSNATVAVWLCETIPQSQTPATQHLTPNKRRT